MAYSLTLEDNELNTVINSLAEMPYKIAAGVLGTIMGQVRSQQEARTAVEQDKPEEKEKTD